MTEKIHPLVYAGPDQGFDVTMTRHDKKVSIALPPLNNVHIDVAIHRVIGLLVLLEDMRKQYGSPPARP